MKRREKNIVLVVLGICGVISIVMNIFNHSSEMLTVEASGVEADVTNQVSVNNYDKYVDCFTELTEDKTFIPLTDLAAEDAIYQDLYQRLMEEESENIAYALESAMNLFFMVAFDNGNMVQYSQYESKQQYVDIGMGYMTDIINGYKKNSGISYYNVLYIAAHYGHPKNSMNEFMWYMNERSYEIKEYSSTELEALELCKMYLTTFYNHRQNIEAVGECLLKYADNHSKYDMNHLILCKYKEQYQKEIGEYYTALEDLESYFN